MTTPTKFPYRLIFRSLLLMAAVNPAGAALAQSPADKAVPATLRPADNEQLATRLAAIGVQIYECKAAEGKPPQWAFVAPEADLFEAPTMKRIGKHYTGPHWELTDGSKVVGAVKQRADASNAGAIPWLLLSTKSAGGAGRLEKVSSIQRLNTVGGVAPDSGCTAADLGKQARVYYTADYTFYQPK